MWINSSQSNVLQIAIHTSAECSSVLNPRAASWYARALPLSVTDDQPQCQVPLPPQRDCRKAGQGASITKLDDMLFWQTLQPSSTNSFQKEWPWSHSMNWVLCRSATLLDVSLGSRTNACVAERNTVCAVEGEERIWVHTMQHFVSTILTVFLPSLE